MARQEHINEYFNGRPFMVLCAVALVVTAVVACSLGVQPNPTGENGVFFTLWNPLIPDATLSATVNVLCLLLTGGILLAINKVFTFVRSMTHLFVSAFFLLQMANPSGLVSFNAGTLLALVTVLTLMPLFASCQDHHSQHSIFLIFTMVTAGMMFHYGFLMLIPAYLLGFLNMRAMGLKGVLAMLFGLVTPFWIAMGLGIASPADFALPHYEGFWQMPQEAWASHLTILVAATAVLGAVLAVMNLYTIMNYRLQTRVYNIFFIIVLVLAIIAICFDFKKLVVYLPLLNLTVAVQVAHVHTLRTAAPYRYLFILLFTAACLTSCVANLMQS